MFDSIHNNGETTTVRNETLALLRDVQTIIKMEKILRDFSILLEEIRFNSINKILRQSQRIDLDELITSFEAQLIKAALSATHGRQREAAELLGIKPTTLNSKIKRYNIETKNINLGIIKK